MSNSEKAHRLAYRFLCALSDHLKKGTVHLYDCNGRLLQTLDEVTLAVKDGRWPVGVASNPEESIDLNGGIPNVRLKNRPF